LPPKWTTTKKKPEKAKDNLNKKLLYTILLSTLLCLAFLLSYYFLVPQSGGSLEAAIVDQLSIEANLVNNAFVEECTSLINAHGFDAKYYEGETVTIDFYRNLPSKSSKILVLRAHSSLRGDTTSVDLFTSEPFSQARAENAYFEYVINGHISKAVFDVRPPPNNTYFAIGPSFVTDVMQGEFDDSLIILMGCVSLNQTTMAEALVNKGARVVIGWTKKVDLSDTDASTLQLLSYLLAENPYTVRGAVEEVNTGVHSYNSTLDFYPKDHETEIYKVPKGRNLSSTLSSKSTPILLLADLACWKHNERLAICLDLAARYS